MQPHESDSRPRRVLTAREHALACSQEAAGDTRGPLVSVVVAVYNVEKYLSQCLDSLVNQRLKEIEIIVVNDASTDGSANVISDYASKYLNIRALSCEKNRGLATVRNIGMAAAIGEYVAFVDGDDWIDVRMCETMYRRAKLDDSDVLIADANVFYDDSKTFGPFFDQKIRQALDSTLRTRPFTLTDNPRVLLLEPVAWTKLYRRSFLQENNITFEDGMNSYEDICFHFTVLLKAKKLSLIDDALSFYRQNRPGQISGRTNRKIFEVFDVFQKIHNNLATWNVSADIWAMLVQVQLHQFDWLLKDRVRARDRGEFFSLVTKQFRMIPKHGLQAFARQASVEELGRLCCMRRGWLRAYERAARQQWPVFPLAYLELGSRRRGALRRGIRHGLGVLRRRSISSYRSFLSKSLDLPDFEEKLAAVSAKLNQIINATLQTLPANELLVRPHQIRGHTLFLSEPHPGNGVAEAVWKMQCDYYLSQAAIFREGDIVVDVGSHVGVFSIYLAMKNPFIKVFSAEPDPLNYACLKRNIEANRVENVIAINKAVSADGRNRTLYVDAWNSGWATTDARMASTRSVLRTEQISSVTLEQLFNEHSVRHCRLLKITAPGAITECLNGVTRSSCVDVLCGEADLGDCSRVRLEAESWRIARQHFWRTVDRRAAPVAYSWIHQIPTGIEQGVTELTSIDPVSRHRNVAAGLAR